jgi:tRNA U34 5-carboxymethylaminomethyl modifying GTPase MnmE/TrmE
MEDSQFNPEEIESLNNSRIEESLKLIELIGSKVQLNFRALEFIKMIEEELIIVTIFGKPKSGKSFLMNLLNDNLSGVRRKILIFLNISYS